MLVLSSLVLNEVLPPAMAEWLSRPIFSRSVSEQSVATASSVLVTTHRLCEGPLFFLCHTGLNVPSPPPLIWAFQEYGQMGTILTRLGGLGLSSYFLALWL